MKNRLVLLIVLALLPSPLFATQVVARSVAIDNLSRDAQDIISFKCKSLKTEALEKKVILADSVNVYSGEVLEVAKGGHKAGDTISFKIHNIKSMGMPVLRCDGSAEAVLFLSRPSDDGSVAIVGLTYGKIDVARTSEDKRLVNITATGRDIFKDLTARRPSLSLNSRQAEIVQNPQRGQVEVS
ncbi:MAG: hypothetical protein HYY43_00170, partial [Deltaproteobacteria bacterium]|nr:hypothetical protein [Deltaproteobacteria bacterium]